jgi:hypothetical protein
MKPISEDELDKRYQTKSKLESGGDYGLDCLVFAGNLPARELWFDDDHFRELCGDHDDIGTILIDGDLRCSRISVSDRLMNLVITGNLVADELNIFETEVTVYGNLEVGTLLDHDDYLKVLGKKKVGRRKKLGE